jgi:hypothetical protein
MVRQKKRKKKERKKKKEKKRTIKGYGSAASVDPIRVQGPGWLNEIGSWIT